jgi:hypothetical protein
MSSSIVISVLATLILTASVQVTEAEQLKKLPTIGFLTASFPEPQRHLLQAFKQGLLDLGYIEGVSMTLINFISTNGLDSYLNRHLYPVSSNTLGPDSELGRTIENLDGWHFQGFC